MENKRKFGLKELVLGTTLAAVSLTNISCDERKTTKKIGPGIYEDKVQIYVLDANGNEKKAGYITEIRMTDKAPNLDYKK